jgi:hypothetical protein
VSDEARGRGFRIVTTSGMQTEVHVTNAALHRLTWSLRADPGRTASRRPGLRLPVPGRGSLREALLVSVLGEMPQRSASAKAGRRDR